jgi:hypothetical protein
MTRFLANWEVESDIILPNEIPFLRHEHPTGTYIMFLRNLPEKRHDIIFLTMQIVFDAPSLNEAKEVVEPLAKEFLDYLTFASNMRTRLRDIRQIFNWEPGNDANRECHYYTPRDAHNGAPFDALDKPLLDTIGMLQAHSPNPRLRRAMKWFANGVSSRFYDDQFVYFWLVLELIAQNAKDPTPVPDKCPNCQGPLFCETCQTVPTHRPYQKQAIEQLFIKTCADKLDGALFFRHASGARNLLMHGDEVKSIEQSLGLDFGELVDKMGNLAWTCILNQFVRVLIGKRPMFLQPNHYVYMTVGGSAHINVGFKPDFDNPDPANFPKIDFKMTWSEPRPTLPPTTPPPP